MQKVKRLRKSHGIYPILGLFNLGQLPLHLVYIGLINKLATDYTIRPEILTEGLFWFKDLQQIHLNHYFDRHVCQSMHPFVRSLIC